MNVNVLSLGAACALLLVGCGGGSSTPASEDMVLTGVFVDSAVEGVTYATQTQSGTTNAAGEFSYLAGEQVTFSIGAAQLPAVAAAAQITPVDIAASSATPAAMTTNIARLLQSLDQDGNPDNGITISADAAVSASQLNFDVSTAEFENNAEVINLVANSGSINTSLITSEAASSHLSSTLAELQASGQLPEPEPEPGTIPTTGTWYQDNDVYASNGDHIEARPARIIVVTGSTYTSYLELRAEDRFDPDFDPFLCYTLTSSGDAAGLSVRGYKLLTGSEIGQLNLASNTC